jgi:hypothetical protein
MTHNSGRMEINKGSAAMKETRQAATPAHITDFGPTCPD